MGREGGGCTSCLGYARGRAIVSQHKRSSVEDGCWTDGICEASRFAGDGEEGFEDFSVETAFGVLGRLVGHEAVDEGVRGGLHDYTREGSVEEVGIVVDALLESRGTEVCQEGKIVVVGGRSQVIQLLELFWDDEVVVAAESKSQHVRFSRPIRYESTYYSYRSPLVGDTSLSYLLWEPEIP